MALLGIANLAGYIVGKSASPVLADSTHEARRRWLSSGRANRASTGCAAGVQEAKVPARIFARLATPERDRSDLTSRADFTSRATKRSRSVCCPHRHGENWKR